MIEGLIPNGGGSLVCCNYMTSALGAFIGGNGGRGAGIRRGIHTIDDIQEATSKAILGERVLEARLLPESLQVADPRSRTQGFLRRCACLSHAT